MTDKELVAHAIRFANEKHHSRIKGYYACGYCAVQFIFKRAFQTRTCPNCNRQIKLLAKVDEYEIERIRTWSYNNLFIEGENMTRESKLERSMA